MTGILGESSVDTLPEAERLVLWAVRTWVDGRRRDETADVPFAPAFIATGAADAAPLLHRLMVVMTCRARRPIRIAPPTLRQLMDDEMLILDAVALAQAGAPIDALLALRPILDDGGCRALRQLGPELGAALARGGLRLHRRLVRMTARRTTAALPFCAMHRCRVLFSVPSSRVVRC